MDDQNKLFMEEAPQSSQFRRNIRIRHRTILQYIYHYSQQHGYAPTMREITEATHISSTSVVSYHLAQLEKWGLLCRTDNTSRSLILAEAAYPLIGKTPPRDLQTELARLQIENHELRQRCEQLEHLLSSLS